MEPHDQDLYEWARQNAQLIREGRLDEIDAENIADELEAMSNSERRELLNRLTRLIAHLLKWQYQPGRRSQSWINTIDEQRRQIEILLEDSPSLHRLLPEILVRAYRYARKDAAKETGLSINIFPAECLFPVEQILQEGFLPQEV